MGTEFQERLIIVLFYRQKRSQGVVRRIFGETFDGVLITDCYGGYNAIECAKLKCWVHLLRELREHKDKYQGNKEIIGFARRLKTFSTEVSLSPLQRLLIKMSLSACSA